LSKDDSDPGKKRRALSNLEQEQEDAMQEAAASMAELSIL
jgi:hypothetical protein